MVKADLYNHEKRFQNWKANISHGENGLTKPNSDLLIQYILDMEQGVNINLRSKKGGRSPHRLNNVRQKLSKVFRMLQERKIIDVRKIEEKQIQSLFEDMRKGIIKTDDGNKYKSVADYAKAFTAFWHWWQKVNNKKGKAIRDITQEIDKSEESKPIWVYCDEEQTKEIINKSSSNYAILFEFLFDTGARVTETFSLKVKDIELKNGIVYVNISDEIAKSVGRKIKLLLCGQNILRYIKENNLKPDEQLFQVSHDYANYYLRKITFDLFGDSESRAGEKYSKMSLYDWRHISCCYWLPKYKTESGLMYRFGWKSSKYIHYYSEFLGMKDNIRDEDLYSDITKTELEREIERLKEKMSKMITEDDIKQLVHGMYEKGFVITKKIQR
jgi:site-specific recombinase XerD